MFKRLFVFLTIISSLAFACPNKEIHKAAEDLIKDGTFAKVESNVITVDAKRMALGLMLSGKTEQETIDIGKAVINGMTTYAVYHDYAIKITTE